MASRTQLRLGQITGSFADVEGGIVDNLQFDTSSTLAGITLPSGSMVGVLSEIASSIKRIHGAATFAGADTGEFGTSIKPDADLGQDLGTSSVHWGTLHVGQVDATGVTGSISGTGITNDQVVVSNNGALEGDSNFTWNGTLLTLAGQSQGTSQLSVSGDATIAGDLTVQGSTVTLNTTNTTITDRLFFLHDGNTVNAGNANGTSAIAFASGSATANESTIIGTLGNDIIAVARMDAQDGTASAPSFSNLVSFRAKDIEVAGSTNKFEVDSSNLTAVAAASFVVNAATDITLDADSGTINFEDNGTRTGLLKYVTAQNTFALSSSAGNDLALDGNTGNVMFTKDGAGGSSPATAAVNVATANEIKFGNYDAPNTSFNVGFLNLKTNAVSILSASSGLQIDAGSAAAELRLVTTGSGAEFVSLKAPSNISGNSNLTFVLPAADGTANQVLQTDGSGNLTFGDASATATTKKQVLVIDAGIAAGTDISIDSGETGVSYIGDTIDDLSQGSDQGKVLDVFVNGQLLVSGSNAQRIAGSRDYEISSATELAFAFDLEADDLVQIIKRG